MSVFLFTVCYHPTPLFTMHQLPKWRFFPLCRALFCWPAWSPVSHTPDAVTCSPPNQYCLHAARPVGSNWSSSLSRRLHHSSYRATCELRQLRASTFSVGEPSILGYFAPHRRHAWQASRSNGSSRQVTVHDDEDGSKYITHINWIKTVCVTQFRVPCVRVYGVCVCGGGGWGGGAAMLLTEI